MLETLLFWSAAAAGLVWFVRNVALTIAPRWVPVLRPEEIAGIRADNPPKVSLVVAAKDEAAGIERCVRSLLAQDYPNLEIIIVDDRSADRTAEIVEGLAAADPRLRLVRVTELPAGWFGKAHAVHKGLAAAAGEWFCLTDADCVMHDPRLVTATVARAVRDQADFLTLLPMIDMHLWWQKLTDPLASGVVLLANNPLKVNDPSRKDAAAFAGFMLIRRSAHGTFGGHESVGATLGEDIELGRRAKAAGCKLIVLRHDRLYTTASYPTFAAGLRGWSRVLFAAMVTPAKVSWQLLLVLWLSLYPQLLFLGVLGAAAAGLADWNDPGFRSVAIAAGAGWFFQTLSVGRFYRWCGAPGRYSFLYLAGSIWLTAVFVHALGRFRAGANLAWRGTSYPAK